MYEPRILHWVFKIEDRQKAIRFFCNTLQMKVLRHEEFQEGCKAACNGPYDGRWSKTMVGYGPEDSNFVLELTYNYSIGSYEMGNDFDSMVIESDILYNRLSADVSTVEKLDTYHHGTRNPGYALHAPDGHQFIVTKEPVVRDDENRSSRSPVVRGVTINYSHLPSSTHFWSELLGMSVVEKSSARATLHYPCPAGCQDSREQNNYTTVILQQLPEGVKLNHAAASGRIAFSIPGSQIKATQTKVENATAGKELGQAGILTPCVDLATPGKASVTVVILADPDGYEICFVNDEGFRELSKVDPGGQSLLDTAMADDDSASWFKGKNKKESGAI